MQIGNVVVVKGDSKLLGVVTAIDDYDRATVKLNDSGVEIIVEINKLYCTGSTQPQRERAVKSYIFWVQSIKSLLLRRMITATAERRMDGVIHRLRRSYCLTISRIQIA